MRDRSLCRQWPWRRTPETYPCQVHLVHIAHCCVCKVEDEWTTQWVGSHHERFLRLQPWKESLLNPPTVLPVNQVYVWHHGQMVVKKEGQVVRVFKIVQHILPRHRGKVWRRNRAECGRPEFCIGCHCVLCGIRVYTIKKLKNWRHKRFKRAFILALVRDILLMCLGSRTMITKCNGDI